MIEEFHDRTNFESDKYLHINSCGFQHYSSSKVTVLRSKGRKDYHFLYVVNGICTAETMQGQKCLAKGDLLLYRPNEKQMYTFEPNGENETYWIHFAGSGAENILNAAGFAGQSVIHIGCDKILMRLFDKIINDFVPESDNIMSISWFLQFCIMGSRFTTDSYTAVYDERITEITKYMNKNYSENKPIDFYAKICGLSSTRFAHLFKSATGTSPHKYISNLRIRQIKYLLVYSDMNVSEIASAAGFDDPLYMSRLFRKNTGISPKEYIAKYRI